MALMDGRMFGWCLPETRKDPASSDQQEAEEIRPLHCVVHPILRVRLPAATHKNEAQAQAPANEDGGNEQQQDAAAAAPVADAGGEERPQNRSTGVCSHVL